MIMAMTREEVNKATKKIADERIKELIPKTVNGHTLLTDSMACRNHRGEVVLSVIVLIDYEQHKDDQRSDIIERYHVVDHLRFGPYDDITTETFNNTVRRDIRRFINNVALKVLYKVNKEDDHDI